MLSLECLKSQLLVDFSLVSIFATRKLICVHAVGELGGIRREGPLEVAVGQNLK